MKQKQKNYIFDLDDISDLPANIIKTIVREGEATQELLSLFDIKNDLTIDEAIVGLFRKYKKHKDRSWVSSTLYNLKRKGVVKKVIGKKGTYKKT